MVFQNCRYLHAFWRNALGKSALGRTCRGAVNGMYQEVVTFPGKGKPERAHLEVDERYFCVMGLVKGHLSMEIIAHESAHAAFAFVKRKSRCPWDAQAKDYDEESICYPLGRIARAINNILYKAKLY